MLINPEIFQNLPIIRCTNFQLRTLYLKNLFFHDQCVWLLQRMLSPGIFQSSSTYPAWENTSCQHEYNF